jgi:hypothetical protein
VKRVCHVTCEGGDWEGLYVDGVLAIEGHHLGVRDTLQAVGQLFDKRCMSDEDMERLAQTGVNLPDLEVSLDG